ncbi:MAG: TIGR01777 family oxidoreductase [Moraxella sp.]|nr:TIGR01777 family oxidoreductase [Moraxella sp.]
MNVLIAGGSGFLGRALTDALLTYPNTHITWVSRHTATHPSVNILTYQELNDNLAFDVIINLAGAGIIDKRWSVAQKQYLMDSRLIPTQALLNFIATAHHKPSLFISSSAIGWYGAQSLNDNRVLDESSTPVKTDFAHHLCHAWELLANTAPIPTAIIRTGVVMDKRGGMLNKVLPSFQWGLGGQLGSGKQLISWISLTDWVRAVIFILQNSLQDALSTHHCYNLCAPTPIDNATFTSILGKHLHRPTFFHLPAIVVKWLFQERATLLLDGQRVYPKALLDNGFVFQHHTLLSALEGV